MDSSDNDYTSDSYYTTTDRDGTSPVVDLSSLSLSDYNTGLPSMVHDHTRQACDGLDEDCDVLDDPTNKIILDLPPRACSYCGIHSSLVRCLICSKWFCNSRVNTSVCHIVNHLLRAKHEEGIVHPELEGSPGATTLECYKCGDRRIPKLGLMLVQDKGDTAAVLLCRPPCPSIFQNICLNLSLWIPLNKENPFLTWSAASASGTKQLNSRQISFSQMDRLEVLWWGSQASQTTQQPELKSLRECNLSDVGEGQKVLQTQLDKSLAALRDVRAENKRLKVQNHTQKLLIASIFKEEIRWQDKIKSTQHKLCVAERQLRHLDHLTRYKLESREDTAYGQPKQRGQPSASTDVIAAMRSLNVGIRQACVLLTKGLDRSEPSDKHKSQAQKVFGDHLTAIMEDQATKMTPAYDVLLIQSVLQVFMVHWCSSIIEAFYPKQESFADLLVQLSAQTARIPGSAAICGKQIQIVQPSKQNTHKVDFDKWMYDIIEELRWFLKVAGLRIKTRYARHFSLKALALVKGAYDLRTAMAEKDNCGGLEVVIVTPDTPFQEKWMDAQADSRKSDTDQSHVDFVAGTIGIGLQRKVLEKVNGQIHSRMKTELKPTVILERTLNINANHLLPEYLTGHVYAKGHLHIWRLRDE